jgi:hypothetical protein
MSIFQAFPSWEILIEEAWGASCTLSYITSGFLCKLRKRKLRVEAAELARLGGSMLNVIKIESHAL